MKLIFTPHPLSQVNYDPTGISEIALIVSAVSAVAGVGLGIASLASTPKAPAPTTAPSETAAANTAQAAQTQQRQSALAAGGQTNVTGGSGIILGSDVSSVTLVGSA